MKCSTKHIAPHIPSLCTLLIRIAVYGCLIYFELLSEVGSFSFQVMLYPLKARITPMQGNVCIIIIWIVSTCAALPHAVYQKLYQVEFG